MILLRLLGGESPISPGKITLIASKNRGWDALGIPSSMIPQQGRGVLN
ncbi:hypothetical protein GFS31_05800 [Leptolyngbya sp. BL0902]|nr:hypothetical protein GFS31_05800 [Leptolyngbya sp. BL0902]